ncbi:MAG: hypothetical protein M5U26_04640 [Planctomycetota bacterium]|nr:hypothetical protein [Planctomycetota bacterium]
MARGGPSEQALLIHGYFDRRPDGRWGLESTRKRCHCAEGLASDLQERLPPQDPVDCHTCANWHPRAGCVFGANQELDSKRAARGAFKVVKEQARNWVAVEHFKRAIERLEAYLKNRPDDADAFLELARVYDHPGYQEKDKRRAAILYQRFLALRGGAPDDPEVAAAGRRIEVLQFWEPDAAHAEDARVLLTFTCFYRYNALTHFAYAVLTDSHLILAHVGDADPASGVRSVDMGKRFEKASKLVRWISGESISKEREVELTQAEMLRVASLPISKLVQESDTGMLELAQIEKSLLSHDPKREAWTIQIAAGLFRHELVFPEDRKETAEKIVAHLRALGQPAKPVTPKSFTKVQVP